MSFQVWTVSVSSYYLELASCLVKHSTQIKVKQINEKLLKFLIWGSRFMRVLMNSIKSDIPNLIGVTWPSIVHTIHFIIYPIDEIFYADTLTTIFTNYSDLTSTCLDLFQSLQVLKVETKFQFFETAFVSSNKSSTEDLDEVTCLAGKSNNRLTRWCWGRSWWWMMMMAMVITCQQRNAPVPRLDQWQRPNNACWRMMIMEMMSTWILKELMITKLRLIGLRTTLRLFCLPQRVLEGFNLFPPPCLILILISILNHL